MVVMVTQDPAVRAPVKTKEAAKAAKGPKKATSVAPVKKEERIDSFFSIHKLHRRGTPITAIENK